MLRVPARFQGPPGNVNGGMAVGMLVCPASHAARVDGIDHPVVTRVIARIRSGVPVEQELTVDIAPAKGGCAIVLRDGAAELLSAMAEIAARETAPLPGEPIADVPAERSVDVAELASTLVPEAPPFYEQTGDHPVQGCFSCGPENPHGLYIYPRVVSDGVTCAPWRPDAEFDNGDGSLSAAVLTSAIDCSSGICMPIAMQRELLDLDQFFLLGTMDVRYLRVPPIDFAYRVAAKALRRDGRKFFGLSALVGEDGLAYAVAESTWVVAGISRTEAFGAR